MPTRTDSSAILGNRVRRVARSSLFVCALVLGSRDARAVELDGGELVVIAHADPGSPLLLSPSRGGSSTVVYSNVNQDLGLSVLHGGATTQGFNTITKLVADDVSPTGCNDITVFESVTFSVVNASPGDITAQPRFRLYLDEGGVPGTLVAAFRFSPTVFPPGVTLFTSPFLDGPFNMQPSWAGLVFDNNNGATGATADQLNQLGQGVFGPVDQGSSTDELFFGQDAGVYLDNNPTGTVVSSPFGGSPAGNLGWQLTVLCGGLPVSKTTWGHVKGVYR